MINALRKLLVRFANWVLSFWFDREQRNNFWLSLRKPRFDRRSPEQRQQDHEASVLKTVRQKTATYKTNIFKRTLSHSVFPRYDEVGKKWFTVKRTY